MHRSLGSRLRSRGGTPTSPATSYPLGPLFLDTRGLGNVAPELAESAPQFVCLELTVCLAPDPPFLLTVELGCLPWAPTWLLLTVLPVERMTECVIIIVR